MAGSLDPQAPKLLLEPWCYLEAVENSNVDLHQCLVLPQRGRLPHIQVHLLGHFLKGEEQVGCWVPFDFRLNRDMASVINKLSK